MTTNSKMDIFKKKRYTDAINEKKVVLFITYK